MKNRYKLISCFVVLLMLLQTGTAAMAQGSRPVWNALHANEWYAKQPWLVGSNYLPATAINQLEMWQADSFDPERIDKELGWAQSIGMNTMRVFLHDIVFTQDSAGFTNRIDQFLSIAHKHNIKILFVLFDSVWDPFPQPGKQRDPKPHVHNSGWVQSPGYNVLTDSAKYPLMERYVKGIVGHFAADDRILAWDVWNEPDNPNDGDYARRDVPHKSAVILPLLQKVFGWAREENPEQPLTSGIWMGDWSAEDSLRPMEKLMLQESDVITFHNYGNAADFEQKAQQLQRYNKPLICTEYMARPTGSTFTAILPLMKKYNIGAINWGFVDGKSQTKYPWDSWRKTYTDEPPVWFHDVFRADGKPYDSKETALIKQLTANGKKVAAR